MSSALFLCMFICSLTFSLATFAMAFYGVVVATRVSERCSYQEILKEFEEIVNTKLQVVTDNTLEPGVYMPRQEPISKEVSYQKMDPYVFNKAPVGAGVNEDFVQALAELTNGQG